MTTPKVVAGIGGVLLIAFGIWAFVAPASFFTTLADFEPYNEHFLRDIGAFQIGLGAVLLIALRTSDALLAALTGVGTGSAVHTLSHVIDRDAGGTPMIDIPFFAILTVLLLGAAALRARELRAGRS